MNEECFVLLSKDPLWIREWGLLSCPRVPMKRWWPANHLLFASELTPTPSNN